MVVDGEPGKWVRYYDQFAEFKRFTSVLEVHILASPQNQEHLPEVFEVKSIWSTTSKPEDFVDKTEFKNLEDL